MNSLDYLHYVIALANSGVDYQKGKGAICPVCGKRAKVVTTRHWDGGVRIRFHKCENRACVMYVLGRQIKSVEEKGEWSVV